MFQPGTCLFRNILPDEKKVEIAHAGGMDCDNREARTPLSFREPQKVALGGAETQLGNLGGSNPEGALLGDEARCTLELPAPSLPPKIGRAGTRGEHSSYSY